MGRGALDGRSGASMRGCAPPASRVPTGGGGQSRRRLPHPTQGVDVRDKGEAAPLLVLAAAIHAASSSGATSGAPLDKTTVPL
jgi:hypothetical protein